MSIYY